MKTRLKEFMVRFSLNAAELADKIAVQRSSISHIMTGRNLPSSQFIEKLLNAYPELDAGWLITGRGTMLKSPGNPVVPDSGTADQGLHKPVINELKQIVKETPEPVLKKKKIEKVVFFYSDHSFSEYFPE